MFQFFYQKNFSIKLTYFVEEIPVRICDLSIRFIGLLKMLSEILQTNKGEM